MEIINQAINWCKGEIFEGKMSLLFGILVLLTALAYLKFGTTPYSKSMFIPLLIVALLAGATGVYLISTNQKRIPNFQQRFNENSTQFVSDEKTRTEAFTKLPSPQRRRVW